MTRFLLCFLVLVNCSWRNALAENAPQELLAAKKVYLRESGSDRKLVRQIREQINKWGRWELSNSLKDADLVLVLKVETKPLEKIHLKSLEEPHVTQPDEEPGRQETGQKALCNCRELGDTKSPC